MTQTTPAAQATARPWEIGTKDNKGRGIIFGHNRIPVLIYDPQTQWEDVELIIRAVNCHEQLVEALKDITARYERLEILYAKTANINYDCENGSIKRAKQAIAKAEAV